MAGKQHKKERKAEREAQRRAAAKAERRRNLMTFIVVLIVVGLGGVLVWLSLEGEGDDETLADQELQDLMDELEEQQGEDGEEPQDGEDAEDAEPVADVEPCEPAPPPEDAGQGKPTFEEPEQVVEEGVDYRAVVETSCGQVVVDLDEDRAPQAVNSFVFLAQQDFFDGLQVFRNAPSISILQTGSGTNDATWQIGYQLPDELAAAEEDGYPAGAVSMANSGPDTSGSQFFFSYGDSSLPPNYTKFGDTVEGLDVLRSIGAIEVDGETPVEQVYLESVTIETE